jgi:hypothetical protein
VNKRERYYSDDDFEKGITASQLKRLGRARKKEYMRHWFYRNFEDPAQETPYNSQEGGYLYIWGGPYSAHDELWSEFASLVGESLVEEVANEVEGEDGIYDWAPGTDHPATRERHEEALREQHEFDEERRPSRETLEQVIDRLRSGVARPRYGDGFEVEQREAIQADLERLRGALVQVTPPHGGIGHNNPPPDEDSPQAVVVVDVRVASETIGRELAKAEPNALEVAEATSHLQKSLAWLGKKLEVAADSFAKGFGNALGIAAAGGVIAGGALLIPGMLQLIIGIIQRVTDWLSYVTTPF